MKLTEDQAKRVWAILVETCGADDDADGYREQFVHHSGLQDRLEFRFQGKLGFGGKVYVGNEEPPRVAYYSEDKTAKRDEMMSEANRRLCLLWDDWESTL